MEEDRPECNWERTGGADGYLLMLGRMMGIDILAPPSSVDCNLLV